jgi:hypothetical protein
MRTVSGHELGVHEKPRALYEINAQLKDDQALPRIALLAKSSPRHRALAIELKARGYPASDILEELLKI